MTIWYKNNKTETICVSRMLKAQGTRATNEAFDVRAARKPFAIGV